MGTFLNSQRAMRVFAIILSLALGTLYGLWIAPPNGTAVDAYSLRPGKYWVEYPTDSHPDFPVGPITVATFKKDNTLESWKILLVLHVWDEGKRLIAIDEKRVEWKNLPAGKWPPFFEISIENGKKKFTYWHPKAAELSEFYR